MKVTRLQSQNVMKLTAVDITPDGNLVIIGGKNGAGKSSVLDSIAMALGGAALVPVEPIRNGESEAKITVDLGDLIVMRKFSRDPIRRDEDKAATGDNIVGWTETRSTLIVTNKEGAKYPSPQAMLDKLLGKLTFDPLAFSREQPKTQEATLRALVGLDTSKFDAERNQAFSQRAMLKKTIDIKAAQLGALSKYDDAPKHETPLDIVSNKMLEAERARKQAEDAEREVQKTASNGEQLERQQIRLSTEVSNLQAQLQAKTEELHRSIADADANAKELNSKKITAEAARAVVPDVEVIRAELSKTETLNAKVRANDKYAAAEAEIAEFGKQVVEQGRLIEAADRGKRAALDSVKFPVQGLGIDDNGVTFNNIPFSQASSSEQLRVSVAIGLALNPKLKVLLIRNGNLLDDDSLKLVGAAAEVADAQVWMEYVTNNSEGVQVMIEDGHVA